MFDCSELLGKVFDDANRNGHQDAGEAGLPGVRLATVNGELISTDRYGRYHIACAAVPDARIGSNFVLKVDPQTLPSGYTLTQDNPQSIRLTRGKFGELNFGAAPAARTTIRLTSDAFETGASALKPDFARQIDALPASLSGDHPTVLFDYRLGRDEDEAQAQARLGALVRQISARMKALHPKAALIVDTNMSTATIGGGSE